MLNFGEMLTSSAGDAALILERRDHLQSEMCYLIERCTSFSQGVVSSTSDVAASPKFEICDTAQSGVPRTETKDRDYSCD